VVVVNLDIRRPCRSPPEARTSLVVDADAHLALATSLQRFQAIARRHLQVTESASDLQLAQLASGDRLNRREPTNPLPRDQLLILPVGERGDHKCR